MKVRKFGGIGALGVALALAMMVLFGSMGTASAADGPTLELSKSDALDPAGEDMTVKGSGFQSEIPLFVVACDPAIPKGGACDMANFAQAKTDADGAFEVTIKVLPGFGQTDCMKTPCAIQTSKVGDGADRTQEAITNIGFEGGVPKAEDAAAEPADDKAPAADDADKSAAKKSDSDSGSSTPMIVGIVVAVAVLGGLIAFALARRKKVTS